MLNAFANIKPGGLYDIKQNLDCRDSFALAEASHVFPGDVAEKCQILLGSNCSQIGDKVLDGSFMVFFIEHVIMLKTDMKNRANYSWRQLFFTKKEKSKYRPPLNKLY